MGLVAVEIKRLRFLLSLEAIYKIKERVSPVQVALVEVYLGHPAAGALLIWLVEWKHYVAISAAKLKVTLQLARATLFLIDGAQ